MNNSGFGLGFGFTSDPSETITVEKYLVEDDGDNLLDDSGNFLIAGELD
tara:strand:- start:174 stop:320 length:147 start_codon:yes stop_codon:yes gene_type:complete